MRTFTPAAAALVLVQAACGSPALAGELVKVNISDLAFAPADITVQVGDAVEWVNADFIDHTATAKSGDWDVLIPAGKSDRVVLRRPGAVVYYCRFHPGMTGTIHIVAADALIRLQEKKP
ncbi:MAG: cupredoxin domain-containing protein [Hyphomicrobium sp.]|nr:cupredoxin domain-containing protein [Hyphomicrobium sp.]